MVGGQQPFSFGDNAVPVVVSIAGERKVEAVPHLDQSLHRIGRGWIHPDLTIPIHRHESEGGIDQIADHRKI